MIAGRYIDIPGIIGWNGEQVLCWQKLGPPNSSDLVVKPTVNLGYLDGKEIEESEWLN
jgi:hypothetical protein